MLGKVKRRVARIVQKAFQKPIVVERDISGQLPGAFIIAPPRSGTTLLRMIFNSHPEIAAPPETQIFPHLLAPLRDERVERAMWNVGFHPEFMARSIGDFARGFVEAYARSKNKRFWVEKTPTNVDWLPELRRACPDVTFLLLYRHPFDIVRSMMDRDVLNAFAGFAAWRRNYPTDFAACCAYVAHKQEAMLSFQARQREVVHVMRYDQLVTDPEAVIRHACVFLGLEYAPQMLDFASARHDIGFGDENIHETREIVPRVDTFHGWSEEQRVDATTYLKKCLDALNYDARPAAAMATAAAAVKS